MKLLLKFLSLACLATLGNVLILKIISILKPTFSGVVIAAFGVSVEEELRLMAAQVAALDGGGLTPVGFVYQQVGAEFEPSSIWPAFTWTEISEQHAGVFFRVAGGKAAPFGQTQPADMPYIYNVTHCNACDFDELKPAISMNFNEPGETAKVRSAAKFAQGVDNWSDGLNFTWTAAEVRPTNRAIRLWKRTK